MTFGNYITMFLIGYAVFAFTAESLNPFKTTRWDQSKNQRTLGIIAWIAIASAPIPLQAFGIQGFELRILLGLFYIVSVILIVNSICTVAAGTIKLRNRRTNSTSYDNNPARANSAYRIQRKIASAPRRVHRPPVVINADTPVEDTISGNRIKRKLLTNIAGEKIAIEC